jgi:hypothetical protein
MLMQKPRKGFERSLCISELIIVEEALQDVMSWSYTPRSFVRHITTFFTQPLFACNAFFARNAGRKWLANDVVFTIMA